MTDFINIHGHPLPLSIGDLARDMFKHLVELQHGQRLQDARIEILEPNNQVGCFRAHGRGLFSGDDPWDIPDVLLGAGETAEGAAWSAYIYLVDRLTAAEEEAAQEEDFF